jgi:hypothetical protein
MGLVGLLEFSSLAVPSTPLAINVREVITSVVNRTQTAVVPIDTKSAQHLLRG